MALGLICCATFPSLTYAPRDLEAGYPVFVENEGADCLFQVQDMLVHRKQLAGWMKDLTDKSRQVDVVVGSRPSATGRSVARQISRVVRASGLSCQADAPTCRVGTHAHLYAAAEFMDLLVRPPGVRRFWMPRGMTAPPYTD